MEENRISKLLNTLSLFCIVIVNKKNRALSSSIVTGHRITNTMAYVQARANQNTHGV